MKFDLVLEGGKVVTPHSVEPLDIGIADGHIAAIAGPGSLAEHARQTRNVADRLVIPGGIDPHVHCNWPIAIGDSFGRSAGVDVVTRAALFGGTTTVIDFVVYDAKLGFDGTLEKQMAAWNGKSFADYSFHVMMEGEISDTAIAEIPAIVDAGFPSLKVFTTNVRPGVQGRMVRLGSLRELFAQVAASGGIVAVHAEDDDLVMHQYEKLRREGRISFRHMSEVHSALSEDIAFRRVIRLAEHTGAALYIMHVSAATGVRAISEARERRLPIVGETLHQYALRTEDDYAAVDGMKYHTYPSLKSRADVESLWHGIITGAIVTFATDEICTPYAVKVAGAQIDDVIGGNVGVEPRLAVVYTEMVCRRKLGLQRFVETVSTNAAKLFGMFPRKGVIAVGSDADITVLEVDSPRVITASDLHATDYSPWEGWSVEAWPSLTLLRGKTVVEGSTFHGQPAEGVLVARRGFAIPNAY